MKPRIRSSCLTLHLLNESVSRTKFEHRCLSVLLNRST